MLIELQSDGTLSGTTILDVTPAAHRSATIQLAGSAPDLTALFLDLPFISISLGFLRDDQGRITSVLLRAESDNTLNPSLN